FEIFLLLAGSVAAIAAVGLAAYRGFSGKKITTPMQHTITTSPATAVQTTESSEEACPAPAPSESISVAQMTPTEQMVSAVPSTGISISVAAAAIVEPVPEAPAPFAEDFTPKTTVPTDVSAVSNFAGPTESAVAPVLVIQAPKLKRTRSPPTRRRLPTSTSSPGTSPTQSNSSTPTAATTTPKRRRSTRARTDA